MEKLDQLLASLNDLDKKIDASLPDDATDAQLAEHAKLMAERKKITDSIGREKHRMDREEERAKLAADADKARRIVPRGRITDADVPNAHASPSPRVEVKTPDHSKDPKRGFRHEREFLLSVMDAGQGRRLDERLIPLQATVGSDEARGISDPTGGYLIPEGFSPNLMQVNPEDDPIGALTTKIPMARPIVRIPARTDKNHTSSVSGGLTVTRRPETVAGTASQMTLEQVTLEAHSLFGLSYVSEELLSDSPISFAAILQAGFSDQFIFQLINERISGTGVGEFEGVLNSPALVSITKESGQVAATIVYENLLKMRARCWGYGKAIWLANHDTLPQIMQLNQTIGIGGAIVWQPSAREDAPDRLLGRPIIFIEHVPTLGTVGDILLANWSEYLEGLYQPMESAESIHVRFVNHERTFKFWMRNAGRSWWRTALTPKNSSSTLSPFVVTATRA